MVVSDDLHDGREELEDLRASFAVPYDVCTSQLCNFGQKLNKTPCRVVRVELERRNLCGPVQGLFLLMGRSYTTTVVWLLR
jgi:hypothetical protein